MQLTDYLRLRGITATEFAQKVGITVEALRRYRTGRRLPTWDILLRIEKLTGGEVMPNDFRPAARRREARRANA